ncbi:Putative uncharacterized protein [Moritella viscosa]|nr:C25 family cysteine peptidase [Moritella viscosa]SHO06916.1 Putative uncharacterized protein [Moritella viscosa]SHO21785.1 Putative uncharacterized protein [Moritella viscosa]
MKKILLSMICFLSVLPVIASEHVDSKLVDKKEIFFGSPSEKGTKHISIISQDAYGQNFEATLHSAIFAKVVLDDGITYSRILLPDGGGNKIPGNPNIESYSQMLSIPNDADIELIIDEILWSDTFINTTIDPVQQPFPDVALMNGERPDERLPFIKNEDAYIQMAGNIAAPVTLLSPVYIRGKKFITARYHPIDFNPLNKTVRFATKVRFHLQYLYPEIKGNEQRRQDPLLNEFPHKGKGKSGTNSNFEIDTSLSASQQADYLIITPPEFIHAVTPLAEWKRQMGYQVYVASTDISGNSQEEIKAFIKDAYGNGTMTSYVLLVGDHEDLPAWEQIGHSFHGKDHKWYTDFEYSLLDGNDNYPDIVIGRLPGDTADQITAMVNKTLTYQKKPAISERYNHVLLAGQFQDSNSDLKADRMFMEDLHRLADFLGPDYDFFDQTVDPFNKGFQIHTALKWDSATNKNLTYGG